MRRLGYALLWTSTSLACLSDRGYACEDAEQCLAAADGACEADRWCSYPDGECESGRAYGPHAPQTIAGTCVEPPAGDSTGDTGSESDESGDTPTPLCGDGVVDPGETCDDGNRLPGDACHPQCVEPGTPAWTVTYDGEAHFEDRGFGLAVDESADAIYVIGFTTVDDMDRDILVQRWRLDTGELVWTRAIDGGVLGDDTGEHVEVDSMGNVIATGTVTPGASGTDVWLAKFTPQGETIWTVNHDAAGPGDIGAGVSVAAGDEIIVVGEVEVDGRTDAWMQRFDTNGVVLGESLRWGTEGWNRAIDTIADGSDFIVTGSLESGGVDSIWTARYGPDGTERWTDLAPADPSSNQPRGVGMGFDPLGGSATAGVTSNDVWLRRFDAAGTPTATIVEAGPAGSHDEAADVAFSADGSFVVVGFLDFSTEGFARGDIWVRRYSAEGEPIWTDRFDGAAKEIDKALGVVVTDDLSAVVVGYETVPGQARDLWLRRYAL